jgi:hypothetical protein
MAAKPLLCTILIVLTASCAGRYDNDAPFLIWINATEAKCASQYGDLPAKTPAGREEYLQLAYETYYGGNKATFASRMGVLYPDHQLIIGCIASSFPDLGLDSK